MLGKTLQANYGWSINIMLCSFFFWIWIGPQPTRTQLPLPQGVCAPTFLDVLTQVSPLSLSA